MALPCEVEIADAEGELHRYWVSRLPSLDTETRPATGSLRFQREDAEDSYTVRVLSGGHSCTCPDWTYRWRDRPRGCKHLAEAHRLLREEATMEPNALPGTPEPAKAIVEAPSVAALDKPLAAVELRPEFPHQLMTVTSLPPAFPPQRGAPPVPRLALALAAAQQKCQAVAHDARNDFHRYDYTSSEAVIAEAKRALGDSGLALLPVEQTVNGHERTGTNRFELVRKFVLLHGSGECLPLTVAWPIVEDKGRPLDKATAIAATVSLAYLLRDLLLMPRVDQGDEMAARDDPRPEPQKPPPRRVVKDPQAPAAKPTPPGTGSERVGNAQLERLDALFTELKVTSKQYKDGLAPYGVDTAVALTVDQANDVERRLLTARAARLAKTPGVKRVEAAMEAAEPTG